MEDIEAHAIREAGSAVGVQSSEPVLPIMPSQNLNGVEAGCHVILQGIENQMKNVFESEVRAVLGKAVRNYTEAYGGPDGYAVDITIKDNTPIRISDLARLSEILGTDGIDIRSGEHEQGWSEYTPPCYSEGRIEARHCRQ